MNLVRFNPGLLSLMENMEKNHFGFHREFNGDVPSVNIVESDQQFTLDMAVPGMKKEDFKIDLENNVLTISSEVKDENEESKPNYTRREFVYSSFKRSFTIPKNIQHEDIAADYTDGILRLVLPKKEETKLSRSIAIR